jgi:hypothetical protein
VGTEEEMLDNPKWERIKAYDFGKVKPRFDIKDEMTN